MVFNVLISHSIVFGKVSARMAVSFEAQGPLPSLLEIGRIQFPVVVGLTEGLTSQRGCLLSLPLAHSTTWLFDSSRATGKHLGYS